MKKITKKITTKSVKTALAMAVTTALSGTVFAAELESRDIKILQANFDSREVVQVETGGFHFKPGQAAPIHIHAAPTAGYVMKGEIIYQVEGEKQVILREGDAFSEPVGARILRFENASVTEEATFVHFNFQQPGEPFIVVDKKLTRDIERRTLPTLRFEGKPIKKVNVYKRDMGPRESVHLDSVNPVVGVVAEGVVVIRKDGMPGQRVVAGDTFSIAEPAERITITNGSYEVPAKIISFRVL